TDTARGIELLLALFLVLRLLLLLVGRFLLGLGLLFFFLLACGRVGLLLRVFHLFGLAKQRLASEKVVLLRARTDGPVALGLDERKVALLLRGVIAKVVLRA